MRPAWKCLSFRVCAAGVAFCVLAAVSGCGSDSIQTSTATATPLPTETATPLPTFTATSRPTSTPTPRENENLFGSTQTGGGTLTIDSPLGETGQPTVDIYLSNSIGGNDIYIGTDPGFKEAEADEPSFPLFTLTDGIPITLEIVAIDPAVNLIFDQPDGVVTLTQAGQSIGIGTTPGIHQDLEWQLTVPTGSSASGHSVSVKLTTASSTYRESAVQTLQLLPTAGQPPE